MIRQRLLLVAVMTMLIAGSACDAPEPRSPVAGLTKPVDPPKPPDLGRGDPRLESQETYHLWLGESLGDICKGPSPFFDFDSAAADAKEQPTMQVLSTCMVTGPLKGKSIRLIGHTDPRGSANYNEKLGMQRAERVKRYLVTHGVEENRVITESVGEEEASGSPSEWARDRRVEIRLAR